MVKLFVGGFPPDTEEIELVQLLSGFGQVSTIQIMRDKISGRSKGYAFIELTDQGGADAVLENLDATEFKTKELSIRFATPKTESPAFNNCSGSSAQVELRIKKPRRLF